MTKGELLLLNNALNETLHGIAATELSTRIGRKPEQAQALLVQVSSLLTKLDDCNGKDTAKSSLASKRSKTMNIATGRASLLLSESRPRFSLASISTV